jgi:methyl-galactoside transport system substrate-binding protein
VIPVFGVDATEAAKGLIAEGKMTGTIKQDADGMASAIVTIGQNFLNGTATFTGVTTGEVIGTWRVNIPYAIYQ